MDLVIYHRVAMILAEMGLHGPISLIEDFNPDFSIKNCGPHRLYEFQVEIRDDVDPDNFIREFCTAMQQYNERSSVKADFYDAVDYSSPVKNWSTVYLTVTTI